MLVLGIMASVAVLVALAYYLPTFDHKLNMVRAAVDGLYVDPEVVRRRQAEEERIKREDFAREHEKRLSLLAGDPRRPRGGSYRSKNTEIAWDRTVAKTIEGGE